MEENAKNKVCCDFVKYTNKYPNLTQRFSVMRKERIELLQQINKEIEFLNLLEKQLKEY